MSAQQQLFDPAEGQRRKELGKKLAAGKHAESIANIRHCLLSTARNYPSTKFSSDDAHRWAGVLGYPEGSLGNAMGNIFNTDDWEFTGSWIASKRPSAHGRMVRVWKLR